MTTEETSNETSSTSNEMSSTGSNSPVTVARKLSKDEYALLLHFEQTYWRAGFLPTKATLKEKGWSNTDLLVLEEPVFLNALAARGIPEHLILGISGEPSEGLGLSGSLSSKTANLKNLSEKQLTVANVMLDTLDKRSRLKKLTELGVSTSEYNSWLRDPHYREYVLSRAEALLEENQHIAHTSLIERVAQGDLGAIKYFNSLTGRYRERASAGVEVNVQNNFGNQTVIEIIEIIQKHVKDPEVLSAIGDDILALTTRGLGSGAVGPVGSNSTPAKRNYSPLEIGTP